MWRRSAKALRCEEFRRAADVHDVVGRAHRRRSVPGQGRDPVRPRRRRGRHGARPGTQAGFDRLIGFDMGGTSTDVSHYRRRVRARLRDRGRGRAHARADDAASTRSRRAAARSCIIDGARFRVGPDSAGANPGPACYRRGGPLAVTDANVMVGKLIPDFSRRSSGPTRTSRSMPRRCGDDFDDSRRRSF